MINLAGRVIVFAFVHKQFCLCTGWLSCFLAKCFCFVNMDSLKLLQIRCADMCMSVCVCVCMYVCVCVCVCVYTDTGWRISVVWITFYRCCHQYLVVQLHCTVLSRALFVLSRYLCRKNILSGHPSRTDTPLLQTDFLSPVCICIWTH